MTQAYPSFRQRWLDAIERATKEVQPLIAVAELQESRIEQLQRENRELVEALERIQASYTNIEFRSGNKWRLIWIKKKVDAALRAAKDYQRESSYQHAAARRGESFLSKHGDN